MVILPLMLEIKIYEALRLHIHILALQILLIAVIATCLSVQRIADRIEDHRLTGAGISADQEQSFMLKLREIKLCLLHIRTKSLHNQFSWFHRIPASFAASIIIAISSSSISRS